MDGPLDQSLRAIAARNQASRAEFAQLSARVLSLTLTGTREQIDEFSTTLDQRLSEILAGPTPDSAVGGAGGSESYAEPGGGESTQ